MEDKGQRLFSFSPRVTGYYPTPSAEGSAENRREGGNRDRHGHLLNTLQDHIAGKAPFCSVAMDAPCLPFGTKLCIPAFNKLYETQIEFRVVDTGEAFDGRRFTRMDICVENKRASLDDFLNGLHDVVALLAE